MSASKPSLDDLISAQRASGGMTETQRSRNRAQLLSRAVAGTAASASAASALAASAPSGALGWAAKVGLSALLLGGAGVGYLGFRPTAGGRAPVAATHSAREQVVQPASSVAPRSAPSVVEAAAVEPAASAAPPASSAKSKANRLVAPNSSSALAAEVALLHDVEAALGVGDAARALTLLEGPSRGNGFMAEERAVAHIVTLCQLGRVEPARAEAMSFLRDHPRSPLASRVRATCAKPTESAKPN